MIIQDAYHLLIQNGGEGTPDVPDGVIPGIMSVLQVEPEDSLDMVYAALRRRTNPIAIVLPENGTLFEHPDHFVRLRKLLEGGEAEGSIGFVIPRSGLDAMARYAHEQGFFFASSLNKMISLSLQRLQLDRSTQMGQHSASSSLPLHERTTMTEEIPIRDGNFAMVNDQAPYDQYGPQEQTSSLSARSRPSKERRQSLFSPPPQARRRLAFIALLTVLLASALLLLSLAAPLASHFSAHRKAASSSASSQVGTLAFTGSGQIDPRNSRGFNDQVTLDLHGFAPSVPGTPYYAWLLPDDAEKNVSPLLLGTFTIGKGKAHLEYQSPNHLNLLQTFSQFRVTATSSIPLPGRPPADPKTWIATGEFSNIAPPGDEQHYSFLSHLRHLLAQDPTLRDLGLPGGLAIWLSRNTEKLLEYASSARDDWGSTQATGQLHRQMIRILDYLDGASFVWQDVPAGSPFLVDPLAARVGLLDRAPNQSPPGYLSHVALHLQGLINAPGHTEAQALLATRLAQVIRADEVNLKAVREEVMEVGKMDAAHLRASRALTLLDDLVQQLEETYAGGREEGGGVWLYQQLQSFAVMPIMKGGGM